MALNLASDIALANAPSSKLAHTRTVSPPSAMMLSCCINGWTVFLGSCLTLYRSKIGISRSIADTSVELVLVQYFTLPHLFHAESEQSEWTPRTVRGQSEQSEQSPSSPRTVRAQSKHQLLSILLGLCSDSAQTLLGHSDCTRNLLRLIRNLIFFSERYVQTNKTNCRGMV